MQVTIHETPIKDLVVVQPELFRDERGFFTEVFRKDQFQELGLPTEFVQLNQSGSVKNTIRGLHFQWDPPMGKLMRVTSGRALLVAVDIRKGSPTLGQWFGIECSCRRNGPRHRDAPDAVGTGKLCPRLLCAE